jgi:hypothetical protein
MFQFSAVSNDCHNLRKILEKPIYNLKVGPSGKWAMPHMLDASTMHVAINAHSHGMVAVSPPKF